MRTLQQNLRYGLRVLLKNPGFTSVAVLTLALGIGANAAIFSVINAVLLRQLPYRQSDRILTIWGSFPTSGLPKSGLSQLEFYRLRDESQVLKDVSAQISLIQVINLREGPERISTGVVTVDLFRLLGVEAQNGRVFASEDGQSDASNVVLLAHSTWRKRFNSDPNIVGQSLTMGNNNYTVVGVLPADFRSPGEIQANVVTEIWRPLRLNPAKLDRSNRGLNVFARLREGATMVQAQAELNNILGRVAKENPSTYPADGSFRSFLTPLKEEITGDVRTALLLVLLAVGLVLLIACANIANLLLVRGESRQKEIAIRAALGAKPRLVVVQLLMENLLLALIGGLGGLLLAYWGLNTIIAFSPGNIPRLLNAALDWQTLGYLLLVSLLTGLVFGTIPALQAIKVDLQSTLKEGGRAAVVSPGRNWLRKTLVIAEIGLATLLLVNAGLLMQSYQRLQRVDMGFNPSKLLTVRLSPSTTAYQTNQQVTNLYTQIIENVRRLPGVESVAVTDPLPIGGNNNDTLMQISGRPFDMSGKNLSIDFRTVSPSYFQTMGIELVGGRVFEDADQEGSRPVAIINETLARTHWPNEDPIGKQIRLLDAMPDQAKTPYLTIMGVVADAKNRALNADTRQEIFVPLSQHAATYGQIGLQQWFSLVVRTKVDPQTLTNSVRQEVAKVDPSVPIGNSRTMEEVMNAAYLQPRFNAVLLGIFAALALALSAIGIYGVIAYSVKQRTHEIGIRIALGASITDILKMVMGRGLALIVPGMVIGLVGAFAVTRLIKGLLFAVSATDPATFVLASCLLVVIALLACWIPARRAARVDPVIALRYE